MGCLGLDSMTKLSISLLFGGEEDWQLVLHTSFVCRLMGVYGGPTRGGAVQISGRGRASSSQTAAE